MFFFLSVFREHGVQSWEQSEIWMMQIKCFPFLWPFSSSRGHSVYGRRWGEEWVRAKRHWEDLLWHRETDWRSHLELWAGKEDSLGWSLANWQSQVQRGERIGYPVLCYQDHFLYFSVSLSHSASLTFLLLFLVLFNQFDKDILQACLYILDKSDVLPSGRGDAVNVVRVISAMVSLISNTVIVYIDSYLEPLTYCRGQNAKWLVSIWSHQAKIFRTSLKKQCLSTKQWLKMVCVCVWVV